MALKEVKEYIKIQGKYVSDFVHDAKVYLEMSKRKFAKARLEKVPKDYKDFNIFQLMAFCHDPENINKILNPKLLKMPFKKADDPILSTTEDIWQPLYGDLVFTQPHREPIFWNCLLKSPWERSGVRVVTADPSKQGGWTAETDYFPETVKPTFDTYKTDSKWFATRWDLFEKARQHAFRNEGIRLDIELPLQYGKMHAEGIDKGLLADASAEAAAATKDRYVDAVVSCESLDRIISNDDEEDVFGGDHDHWFDPYGIEIDRDTDTTYDSVVLHNSGNDRKISHDLMKQLIRDCEDRGLDPKHSFFLTGRDTRDELTALEQAKLRYYPTDALTSLERKAQMYVQLDVNGIRAEGYTSGFKVASYDRIPIIVDKHVPKDGVSRIYLIDGRFMRFKTIIPTHMFSAAGPEWWAKFQQMVNKFMYLTVGELECVNFRALGKIRDLC